ncbi:NAD(P)/FAD-dependent oxidoreductase [Natronoglycomyces albus]|uniref:NAD(P)/FAD-dependent oxidoreductase n=1 Tax=Natronoglycomyces albus TaxID=2811108 RepID=A0A895XTQ0_9ACTN|nr:NAD(P)/FAD-dependent oxidoreductase [Natronoglycomyces albus]QSB06679.1 NAD(P)/FAD-dependent oxidoreductase [Natronoglycomyces albus]
MTDIRAHYDVVIVGAGPAGLSAALIFGRQQRSVLLADHGEPRNAKAEHMHMYPTRDGQSPVEFRALARKEIQEHPGVRLMDSHVQSITGEDGAFTVTLDESTVVTTSKVLLASGVRDELETIAGLWQRWGSDVVHCAYCHGYETKGRTVAVISHRGEDAMLARYVADRFATSVTLCTNTIEVGEEMTEAAQAGGVKIDRRPVARIDGEPGQPTVVFSDGADVVADVIFHRPAFRQSNDLAASLGCDQDAEGLIVVDQSMATSVPGVFAAGDAAIVSGAVGHTAFVASAVADGQRATVWMERDLFISSMK